MGTEVAISFSSLRAQLESEKSSLFKIDENIKKIVQTSGRFTDRFNAPGDYTRGASRQVARSSYPDVANNYKNEDPTRRKHETKTVFSRLSARAHDSDGEEGGARRVSSAVSRELPSRAAVLRAQGGDAQARTRNRRIFGSLLGTLQKFKQEEIVLQTKEDKKAQVERKIEEQARQEKEREQNERKILFAEREYKKSTIKALEAKMVRVHEFEKWEASQQCLGHFILCKARPSVYWLPKKMSEKAQEKLDASRKYHKKYVSRKRHELTEELRRIEQRCVRRAAPAKENAREPRRRDKFAAERGHGDAHDDDDDAKEEGELDQTKMDTSDDPNTSMDVDAPLDTSATAGEPGDPGAAAQVGVPTDTPAAAVAPGDTPRAGATFDNNGPANETTDGIQDQMDHS